MDQFDAMQARWEEKVDATFNIVSRKKVESPADLNVGDWFLDQSGAFEMGWQAWIGKVLEKDGADLKVQIFTRENQDMLGMAHEQAEEAGVENVGIVDININDAAQLWIVTEFSVEPIKPDDFVPDYIKRKLQD